VLDRKLLVLTAAIAAGSATSAAALPVTVAISGEVIGGTFLVPPELVGLVSVGSSVSGIFQYDAEAQDSNPLATRGDYLQPPGLAFELAVGGASIATDGSEYFIQVLDEFPLPAAGGTPIDRLGVISTSNTILEPSDVAPGQLQFFFYAPDAGIESDGLAEFTEALVAGLVPQGFGQIATTSGQSPVVFINFSVASVELLSLSEPRSSSILATAGLVLLAGHLVRRPTRCGG
jgi:hypothetical protein